MLYVIIFENNFYLVGEFKFCNLQHLKDIYTILE